MCANCSDIILREKKDGGICSQQDYMNCLNYIQQLIDAKRFVLVFASCPLDKVKDENGYWFDDIIAHTIRCKSCGKCYTCSADTFHGGGSFEKASQISCL